MIDWDWLERGLPTKFSDEAVAGAHAALAAMPARKKKPGEVKTLWKVPKQKKIPTISEVDFRDIKKQTISLADGSLRASNKGLDRARMDWHIDHPGQAKNVSPMTELPLVMATSDGPIILDGQHRLAALKLLGATRAPVYMLPTRL